MALLTNLGSTQFLFRARSGTNYVIPVAGNVTVADEEVLYDNVYPSIESGNLQVTMASGLPLLDASSAVLVDPATALAYAAAGGGGSGGLTDTELRATPVPIISGATRQVSTATIASGTSLSTLIDLHGTALLAFIAPAAWDTAAISLEVSSDNVLWATEMYDTIGGRIGMWSSGVAGAAYTVDGLAFLPFRYARVRSGTAATPVAQTADRVFTILTRPLA